MTQMQRIKRISISINQPNPLYQRSYFVLLNNHFTKSSAAL